MGNSNKPDQRVVGDLYLQVAIHRSQEQYTSFMHLQNRAGQVFAIAVAVLGITAAAIVNTENEVSRVTAWLAAGVVLLFLGTVASSSLALRSRRKRQPWYSGPSLQKIEDRMLHQVPDNLTALWLGKYIETSHDRNKVVQDYVGKWLNRSLMLLVMMLLAIVALAVSIVLRPL